MIKPLLVSIAVAVSPLIPGRTVYYEAPRATTVQAEVTAYTSSHDETDEDPNTTASGTVPGAGTIACPSKWPFGTVVEIEGQHFTCEDRMNARYRDTEHYDIWVSTKAEAKEWGRRQLAILIHK